jgi:hypothetical protein
MGTQTPVRSSKLAELHRLEVEAERLRTELYAETAPTAWAPKGYYAAYHILAGSLLGLIGAGASLLFNVVGSLLIGQHPLQIVRVYLTFPLGEPALTMDSGAALAIGCCLYLATGSLYGIAFHLILSKFFGRDSAAKRFLVATLVGLGLWLLNYYGILSWLQPALFGGNWIIQQVPVWIAAATHLIFAWTMLAIDQWGGFEPYSAK